MSDFWRGVMIGWFSVGVGVVAQRGDLGVAVFLFVAALVFNLIARPPAASAAEGE